MTNSLDDFRSDMADKSQLFARIGNAVGAFRDAAEEVGDVAQVTAMMSGGAKLVVEIDFSDALAGAGSAVPMVVARPAEKGEQMAHIHQKPKVAPCPMPKKEPETSYPTGKWSSQELSALRAMVENDQTVEAISKRLKRSPSAVKLKASEIALSDAEEAARPEPKPRPEQAAGSPSDLQWDAHLEAVGNDAPWTAQADLALVESLMRGDGVTFVADKMKIDLSHARDRWKALYNHGGEVSFENQGKLLAAIRRRIGALAGAVGVAAE